MAESESPQLLPGTLFMLILRTLERGPLHGYAIAKRIRVTSGEGLEIEDGSLYPALNRLLVKEWVEAEWGESDTGRRARFYRLTIEGRKHLKKESESFNQLISSIQLVMRNA